MILSYIAFSLVSGILFGVMDGLLSGNPLGARMLAAYKPIARTAINIPAGVLIDVAYGFIMAAIFLLLYPALPGANGVLKGLSFGLLAWFFRVVMSAASQWVMFELPVSALLYNLLGGLLEMLVIGLLYGLALRPAA
jgi:hypothetical protein